MNDEPPDTTAARWRARLEEVWGFTREYLAAVERHSLFSHAAATAYFLFFSIPPLVLALVSLLGLVPIDRIVGTTTSELLDQVQRLLGGIFPRETAFGITYYLSLRARPLLLQIEEFASIDLRERLQEVLQKALPADAAQSIGGIVADILGNAHPGLLTVSFVSILWAASAASRSTSRAMNIVYEVQRPGFLLRNLKSVLMTITILVGFAIALVVFPLLQGLIVGAGALFGLGSWVSWIGVICGWLAQVLLLVFLVVVVQRMGPRAGQSVRSVLPGSALTVLLWVLLSVGLGYWTRVGWEKYNATYGALAGVIVLLLWCYLASLSLLIGAELNALRWRRGVEARTRRRRRERKRKKAEAKAAAKAEAEAEAAAKAAKKAAAAEAEP